MKKLKLPEVLKILKKEGVDIPKRTFEYYQRLGLLPKPEKQVGKGGRGVYGYYYPSVIELIRTIFDLKKKGSSLYEIIDLTNTLVINKYKKVLKDWGFSDYILSEMKDYSPKDINQGDEQIKNIIKESVQKSGIKFSNKENEEGFINYEMPDSKFERTLLERLKWYHTNETIEVAALEWISNEANFMLPGLFNALTISSNQLELCKNKESEEAIWEIIKKIGQKIKDLRALEGKVNSRIAEIIGEYKGKSKEAWQNQANIFEGKK